MGLSFAISAVGWITSPLATLTHAHLSKCTEPTSSALAVGWLDLDWPVHLKERRERNCWGPLLTTPGALPRPGPAERLEGVSPRPSPLNCWWEGRDGVQSCLGLGPEGIRGRGRRGRRGGCSWGRTPSSGRAPGDPAKDRCCSP